MTRRLLLSCLCAGLAVSLVGCRGKKAAGVSHEALVAQLQEEAAFFKKGGEDIHPSLGVKITWILQGLDVKERPGDKDFPWAGTIRFKIHSESRDADGNVTGDTFLKQFDYKYSSAMGKWIPDIPAAKTP
jgi:hypothetical protein